ncbi:MAG: DUF362 domain-containing protein [Clostridia bacterium]|nr:DUF362 domain-containing protein [Clostridia bacterium]
MKKSKVHFIKEVSSDAVIKVIEATGKKLHGNIAIKLHSGEDGNQNYLTPVFWEKAINKINGTVVECNTAYAGERNTTEKHLKLIRKHEWDKYFKFDLMDATGPDLVLPVKNGKHLKENYVGKNMANYDGMIVLSHFKGHPMGGYGGALKQLSIGCASSEGKSYIHSAGTNKNQYTLWNNLPPQNAFLESMAEAASSVVDYFKGNMLFVNVMANMSVDCDCCAVAEDPCLKDIGVLASTDPVAIDRACVDLVKKSTDPGKEHFLERVLSRNGEHTIDVADALGFGTKEYELIEIK